MAKKVKSITTQKLMDVGSTLLRTWDEHKSKIQIRGKALFAFISLKKDLEKKLNEVQETIATIAEQHNGVFKPEIGGFEIPPEQRASANKVIDEVLKEEVEIAYTPITLREEDTMPAEVLDAIFDFVELAEAE